MNILVIGNGFDLAHGLPTKYGDFLEFVKVVKKLRRMSTINGVIKGIDKIFYDYQKKYFSDSWRPLPIVCGENFSKEFYSLIENNIWIDYFLQCKMYQKENWIDFENEICRIVRSMNEDIEKNDFNDKIKKLPVKYFNQDVLHRRFIKNRFGLWKGILGITYQELRDYLLNDLNRLIRALEIYLCKFVESIRCNKVLPEIKGIRFDKVLSFNYTDTYGRIYDLKESSEYDFIHGKANLAHTVYTNNMILGIDEYLPKKRKNKEVEFIAFKKYYQRIYKGTGCKYKDWIYEIKESAKSTIQKLESEYPIQIPFVKFNNNEKHNLFIFGHSLDITDRDILRDLILNDNVYSIIFYYNKDDLGSKIANLVKVISQDELIRRTSGSTKTIEFKLQQDMVERM